MKNMKNENFKQLGTPTTIGILKELIEPYGDDIPFGFRNQPIQQLIESHGMVSFQELGMEAKELDIKNIKVDAKDVQFEPICSSNKAERIENLSNQVKEYFTLGDTIKEHSLDDENFMIEKLKLINKLSWELINEHMDQLPF